MPAKLQSCHFRKETGFHFPQGPQIKPLKQTECSWSLLDETKKKKLETKKKADGGKGSKSSHTCSAQRWVLPRGGWGTSLVEQSPGGPWHSKEHRGLASLWSGTAESLGSHGSLSEETAQPLFFCNQTAINIFCPLLPALIWRAEQLSSDRVQEYVLHHFSLRETSRPRIKCTPITNEVAKYSWGLWRWMPAPASNLWSQFQNQLTGNITGWLLSQHTRSTLRPSRLWWYLHKPPLSNPFWGIEAKTWGMSS